MTIAIRLAKMLKAAPMNITILRRIAVKQRNNAQIHGQKIQTTAKVSLDLGWDQNSCSSGRMPMVLKNGPRTVSGSE